jgi:hypothetical protein
VQEEDTLQVKPADRRSSRRGARGQDQLIIGDLPLLSLIVAECHYVSRQVEAHSRMVEQERYALLLDFRALAVCERAPVGYFTAQILR